MTDPFHSFQKAVIIITLLLALPLYTSSDKVLVGYPCDKSDAFFDFIRVQGLTIYRHFHSLCVVGVDGPAKVIQHLLVADDNSDVTFLAGRLANGAQDAAAEFIEPDGMRYLTKSSTGSPPRKKTKASKTQELTNSLANDTASDGDTASNWGTSHAVTNGTQGGHEISYSEDDPRTCSPGCLYEDTQLSPDHEEVAPYGMHMVEVLGDDVSKVLPNNTKDRAIVVCLIDSGVDAWHPDMAGNYMTGCDKGDACVSPWNEDIVGHGTHVAGIIAAMKNDVGIVGVIPSGTALHVVRIFNDTGATTSDVVVAMMECRDELQYRQKSAPSTKMIVSMSFSGTQYSKTEEQFIHEAVTDGDMLFVAAAGNTGQNLTSYPAGYDAVVSVGAVDCAERHANYSCIAPDIELSAPGTNVRSDVPLSYTKRDLVSNISLPDFPKVYIESFPMVISSQDAYTGPLYDCGDGFSYADWQACRLAPVGSICLIKHRFDVYACDVVTAAMKVGCSAFVLWHNSTDGCSMGVGVSHWLDGCVQQPGQLPLGVMTVAVAHEDGVTLRRLLSANSGLMVSLRVWGLKGPYDFRMGTSMAVPYVTGIAARLWAAGRNCTSEEIRSALQEGAKDLGVEGRDYFYGYGLVNARSSFNALSRKECYKRFNEDGFSGVNAQNSLG